MRYYSTNDPDNKVSLEHAVLKGLADDNGLYMPERIATLPQAFVTNMQSMTLQEISYAVANYALQGDIDAGVLHDIVFETLNFDIPLTHVNDNRFSLELFHGPTMGFKDVGARFLARLVGHFTQRRNKDINVLVASSGNSSGAVANGFHGIPGVNVYILYPQDTLSTLQEAQFTTLGGNITAIEVNGTLNDCKQMVMEAFKDEELNSTMTLTSAKTINIARLLPQTFYYFYAYAQLAKYHQDTDNVVFSVPCGNLGNLTAGLIAKKMGLPVKRFIAGDNKNDIFTQYLDTGEFVPRKPIASIATAMDIGNPRNFSRIRQLYPGHDEISALVEGIAFNDREINDIIATAWHEEHHLLDPQGAVAYGALKERLKPCEAGIALETSHPAKFIDLVEAAIGQEVEVPKAMREFLAGTRHVTSMGNGFNSLKKFLLQQQKN